MVQHIKRLTAPGTWPIVRKGKEKWIASPYPSGHSKRLCVPLIVALRDMLKLAGTMREVKQIIKHNNVFINDRRVTDERYAAGLFDVLTIKEIGKSYRVVLTPKEKLCFAEIKKTEANILPLKVRNASVVKGNKQQINFTNGWNLLAKGDFEAGTTVLYDTKENKLKNKLSLKKGVKVVLVGGKYVGRLATFKEIETRGALKKIKLAVLDCNLAGNKVTEIQTKFDYVFVVGDKESRFTAVASK